MPQTSLEACAFSVQMSARHLLQETSPLLPKLMRTLKKVACLVQLLSAKNKATATSPTGLILKIDVIALHTKFLNLSHICQLLLKALVIII